jgi:hypothetical protein
MGDNREQLKSQLKSDPSFKQELKERVKGALGLRLPPTQPVSYQFDSYMLPDVEVGYLGEPVSTGACCCATSLS